MNGDWGRTCARILLFLLVTLLAGSQIRVESATGSVENPPGETTIAIESALHREDFRRAAALASARLKSHPGDTTVRVLLARVLMAQGDYNSAFRHLRRVLVADPENVDALYYLGRAGGVLAQAEYERLYELSPGSARVHQTLGESYLAQDQPAEAEREFKAALAVDPRSVDVLIALGDLKRAQSDFREALDYYSKTTEIEPRNYDALYGIGACLANLQDHAGALEHFQRALAVNPKSAAGRFALGYSLVRLRRLEEAIPELAVATELEPRMRQAYYLLGQCFQKLGKTAEAQAAFRRVDELLKAEIDTARKIRASEDLIPLPGTPWDAEPDSDKDARKPRN